MTAQLFTPVELGGVTLPNRIVVSPMCQYAAIDGSAQPWHQVHYGMLAMSGAGLLCLEATHVERDGRITQGCARPLQRRERSGAEVRSSTGRAPGCPRSSSASSSPMPAARPRRSGRGRAAGRSPRPMRPTCRGPTVSASAIPFDAKWHTPVALDAVGLKRVKQAFVDATLRSARLGFDVIELHGAHGYLLSQFLSPLSNQRSDEYGGTMEKRRRFPLEVFEACRRRRGRPTRRWACGLSCVEWVEGGVTIEDTIETARQLKALGCDFIDASSGGNAAGPEDPGQAGLSRRVRRPHPQGSRHQDLGGRRHHRARAGRAASSPRARPTAPPMPAPSCSTRAGAGTPPGRSAWKRRPCRCRPFAPQLSCRSSLSPSWPARLTRVMLHVECASG